MRIEIVYPGKTRDACLQTGIDVFLKRLKRFTRLDVRIVKEKRGKGNESDARIKEEEGVFTLKEVFEEVCAKLIRRHPHVFGNVKKETADEVIDQWEHIKENIEGRKAKKSVLERVPRTLPPLERAFFIQSKVSKVGFDWNKVGPVWEKIEEEIEELKEAYNKSDYRETEKEFGDLLFTIVNLGRLMKIDPTLALNSTNQKFINRFQELEKRLKNMGLEPKETNLDHMDSIWNQIKKGK